MKRHSFTLTILISSVLYLWTELAIGNPFPKQPTARLGKGTISQIAYSPDGKLLGAAGSIGVWLYDAVTMKEVGFLESTPDHLTSLAFSPDGKTLAAGSFYKAVQLWDIEERRKIEVLTDHWGRVSSVAFSPDGEYLAASEGKGIHLWNIQKKEPITILKQKDPVWNPEPVSLVTFSPVGEIIASVEDGDNNNVIHLWDAQQRRALGILEGHTAQISFIAFSPDGRTLVSGGADWTVQLWDVANRRQVGLLDRAAICGAYSPDGKILALGYKKILFWDVLQRKVLGEVSCQTEEVVSSLAFSSDGERLAAICGWTDAETRIGVWEVQSLKRLEELNAHAKWVEFEIFSADSKTLVSVGDAIRLWDIERREVISSLQVGYTYPIALSPDGKLIAYQQSRGQIHLWDIQHQRRIDVWEAYPRWVRELAFRPDGKLLASADSNGLIRLWEIETRKMVGELNPPLSQNMEAIQFTQDGKTLISVGRVMTYLWNVETEAPIGQLSHGASRGVGLTPDGRLLASAAASSKPNGPNIRLWDLGKREQIGGLKYSLVNVLALSPDGKFLATSSGGLGFGRDAAIQIWEVETWELVADLLGHTGTVHTLAFSPNGKWLASSGSDGTTLLWEVNLPVPLAVESKSKRAITLGGLKHSMLLQNFPNPFNPETWIPYQLTEDASVAVQIYDVQGTPVRKLDLGHKPAGTYLTRDAAAYWDGRNDYGEVLSSGLYFYQLRADGFSATRRMILAK